jgi:hypothetical protein
VSAAPEDRAAAPATDGGSGLGGGRILNACKATDILSALDLNIETVGPVQIADTPGVAARTEIVYGSLGPHEKGSQKMGEKTTILKTALQEAKRALREYDSIRAGYPELDDEELAATNIRAYDKALSYYEEDCADLAGSLAYALEQLVTAIKKEGK